MQSKWLKSTAKMNRINLGSRKSGLCLIYLNSDPVVIVLVKIVGLTSCFGGLALLT